MPINGQRRSRRPYTDRMDWRIVLERDPESGDWAAWAPDLPGCASAGTTRDEAIVNIGEAIELYLQSDAT